MTRELWGEAAIVVAIIVLVTLIPVVSAEGEGTEVLIDWGNGTTVWSEGTGDTVLDIVISAAGVAGYVVEYGDALTVNGLTETVTGAEDTGGTYTEEGATGVIVKCEWHLFAWIDGWIEVRGGEQNVYEYLALAFYPDGTVPTETPDCRDSWTMYRGDSENSGHQNAELTATEPYSTQWYSEGSGYASPLYAHGNVYVKFGLAHPSYGDDNAYVVCINLVTGEEKWRFAYPSIANFESTTPLIVGNFVYVATALGSIYKIPMDEGPGEGNENVTSFGGCAYGEEDAVPSVIRHFDVSCTYDSGFCTPVAYAGAIYLTNSNGMLYCFDLDLNLVWSYMMDGSTYLISPTVTDGIVYAGALNGHLYAVDACTGEEIADEKVYQVEIRGTVFGGVGQINVFGEGEERTLIFTVSDGRGMSQKYSGIAVYSFNTFTGSMKKILLTDELGTFGKYSTPLVTDDFAGVVVVCSDSSKSSLIRVSTEGQITTIVRGLSEIHSPGIMVNGEYMVFVSYSGKNPVYAISLDGEIFGVAQCPSEIQNYNMSAPLVVGNYLIATNDSGAYVLCGLFDEYVEDTGAKGAPVVVYIGEIAVAAVMILAAVWLAIRYRLGEERPFVYLKGRFLGYLYGEELSHNTRSRHRLRFVMLIGSLLIFLSFTLCISIGSTDAMNPIDAYAYMFSAISKGGVGLDLNETLVFVSRLPRTIAAAAVGIGLAIAGSVYQAIIRNPLVDPYIMGVSSGAGIAAIAVIAFDFTFFGIFSPHSIFLTAISAMIGGLIAFACTMIIAEKAGGSSINYVLAGVVVGLAFSALQTIMLTMSGNKLSNALTWLYGSFAEVTWSQVGVVFFLSVFLSAATLFWAKEFNLVLLGEDQAREMGLNVRRFNRAMLILASVLTSVCVAFCGIIGFVGLVIPHLCRMVLGSDHRMVLPASMLLGPVMLMLADLLARTGYYGIELPVGAITTVIGIPLFAYLLIKKGRIYDG